MAPPVYVGHTAIDPDCKWWNGLWASTTPHSCGKIEDGSTRGQAYTINTGFSSCSKFQETMCHTNTSCTNVSIGDGHSSFTAKGPSTNNTTVDYKCLELNDVTTTKSTESSCPFINVSAMFH